MSDLFDRAAMVAIGSPYTFRARRRTRFEPLPDGVGVAGPEPIGDRSGPDVEEADPARGSRPAPAFATPASDRPIDPILAELPETIAPPSAPSAEPSGVSSPAPDPQVRRPAAAGGERDRLWAPGGPIQGEVELSSPGAPPSPVRSELQATAAKPPPARSWRQDGSPSDISVPALAGDAGMADGASVEVMPSPLADDPQRRAAPRAQTGTVATNERSAARPLRQEPLAAAPARSPRAEAGAPSVPTSGGRMEEGLLASPGRAPATRARPADQHGPRGHAPDRDPLRATAYAASAEPATIAVTIGRIEIRAAAPATPSQRPKRAFAPHLDLEAYRARRERRE